MTRRLHMILACLAAFSVPLISHAQDLDPGQALQELLPLEPGTASRPPNYYPARIQQLQSFAAQFPDTPEAAQASAAAETLAAESRRVAAGDARVGTNWYSGAEAAIVKPDLLAVRFLDELPARLDATAASALDTMLREGLGNGATLSDMRASRFFPDIIDRARTLTQARAQAEQAEPGSDTARQNEICLKRIAAVTNAITQLLVHPRKPLLGVIPADLKFVVIGGKRYAEGGLTSASRELAAFKEFFPPASVAPFFDPPTPEQIELARAKIEQLRDINRDLRKLKDESAQPDLAARALAALAKQFDGYNVEASRASLDLVERAEAALADPSPRYAEAVKAADEASGKWRNSTALALFVTRAGDRLVASAMAIADAGTNFPAARAALEAAKGIHGVRQRAVGGPSDIFKTLDQMRQDIDARARLAAIAATSNMIAAAAADPQPVPAFESVRAAIAKLPKDVNRSDRAALSTLASNGALDAFGTTAAAGQFTDAASLLSLAMSFSSDNPAITRSALAVIDEIAKELDSGDIDTGLGRIAAVAPIIEATAIDSEVHQRLSSALMGLAWRKFRGRDISGARKSAEYAAKLWPDNPAVTTFHTWIYALAALGVFLTLGIIAAGVAARAAVLRTYKTPTDTFAERSAPVAANQWQYQDRPASTPAADHWQQPPADAPAADVPAADQWQYPDEQPPNPSNPS